MGSSLLLISPTENTTLYVATTGSDSNDGDQAHPFLTIQKAIDVAVAQPNNGYNITIQIGDGTYNIATGIRAKEAIGRGRMTIQGNESNPEAVHIISSTDLFLVDNGGIWTLRKVKLSSTGNGIGVGCGLTNTFNGRGEVTVDDVVFGLCGEYLSASGKRAKIIALTTLKLSGANPNATRGIQISGGAELRLGAVITMDAPGATIYHTVLCEDGSLIVAYGSVDVTATTTVLNSQSSRCRVWGNAIVHVYTGAGQSYFPGPDAVNLLNGGVYIT